jgi:hypothetical protein
MAYPVIQMLIIKNRRLRGFRKETRMKLYIINLLTILTVVMLVSIILTGCIPTPAELPEPTLPEEVAPPATPALPEPGEWTASTGVSEFAFTFTVNPSSTGITEFYYRLTELECDGVWSSAESTVECIQIISITSGQFAVEDFAVAEPYGERWGLTVRGRFDEAGTHASGTWEISAEGTICQEGTWEASAP